MQNIILKNIANNKYIIPTLIFTVGLLLFTTAQFNYEFVQFESRFGLFAQEMWRNGISFFPTTYNQLYPDYPATQTILTYLFSLLMGKLTHLTAILPTAITSAATLVFTYAIGSRRSRLWGFYSLLILLFTFNFFGPARSITLDQFTTTATVACFYLVYSAHLEHKKHRLYLLPLFWLFGFMMRGPIGLIIPASVTAGFYLLEQQWRAFFKTGLRALILLMLCSTALLSAAWYQGGINFVHNVIRMEVVGRVINAEQHTHFSYLLIALQSYWISFPLALLVFIATAKQLFADNALSQKISGESNSAGVSISPADNAEETQSDIKLLRHLLFWIVIVIAGFSLTSTAKDRYILPMIPAAALASAYIFTCPNPTTFLRLIRAGLVRLSITIPFVGLLALGACHAFCVIKHFDLHIHIMVISVLLILLCAIAVILIKKNLTQQFRQLGLCSCATATFIILYIGVIQPVDIQFNSATIFVNEFNQYYQPNQDIVFYDIGPDQEDIKFMVAMDKPIQPKFIHTQQELMNYHTPALFITKVSDFAALSSDTENRFKIIFEQKLGHQRCMVFETMSFPLGKNTKELISFKRESRANLDS